MDCGEISEHRGAANSSSRCAGCGAVVGFNGQQNTESIDPGVYSEASFKPINQVEAAKSYVWVDPELITDLKVRELAKPVKLIGSIVLHTLFAV